MLRDVLGKIGDVEIGRVLDSALIGETMQHWFPDYVQEALRAHEHSLGPTKPEQVDYLLCEAGLADLVKNDHELLGCFVLRAASGHVRIELRSRGAVGIFSGGLLHPPVEVPLWHWSSIECWDHAQSAQRLLEDCATENAVLLAGHIEAPHVGRICGPGRRLRDRFRPVTRHH